MSKIKPRDAWAAFTPPTKRNQSSYTVGQIVVDTADRMPLNLNADASRRLLKIQRIVPDEIEDDRLEVYRALLRFVIMYGFAFTSVFSAFCAIENFSDSLADQQWRDPQRLGGFQ